MRENNEFILEVGELETYCMSFCYNYRNKEQIL